MINYDKCRMSLMIKNS